MLYFDSEKPIRIARSITNTSTGISSTIFNMFKSSSNNIIHTLGDKNEICLIFINILVFMIIQTLFYNFVISKEYEVLLQEKMVTIQYYLSNDEDLKANFLKEKKKIANDDEENKTLIQIKAEEQKKERDKINMVLYWYYCIIPILCILFIFVVILLLVKFSKPLTITQKLNFFLVLFVYTPEIIVFMFVVKKFQYIGNIDILSIIYNKLSNKNNINKN